VGCAVSALVGVVVTFLLTQWKLVLVGILLALLGVQTMRIDRAHRQYAELQAQYAEASRKAEADARATERKWHDHAAELGATKDEQIRDIGSKLDAALASLRDRPSRPIGNVPSTSTACKGGTGAGLYRDDGEFLARLASRAATIAAERDYCYARYNDLRATTGAETAK